MFRTKLLALIMVLSALLFSCTGKDGATGPAGPAGTNGTDGNANVILYEFGSKTSSGTGSFLYRFPATQAAIDDNLILSFYAQSGYPNWYAIPGLGPAADYSTRPWWRYSSDSCSYYVELETPDGSSNYLTPTTFSALRIYFVPPSTITSLTSRGVDLSDYNAVKEHLNLPE